MWHSGCEHQQACHHQTRRRTTEIEIGKPSTQPPSGGWKCPDRWRELANDETDCHAVSGRHQDQCATIHLLGVRDQYSSCLALGSRQLPVLSALQVIMPYDTVAVAFAPLGHRFKGVMYMRLLLAFLTLGVLLAASPINAAERGFYVGAGVGQMNTEVDDVFGTGFNFDEDDVGFKLFGGYRFFPWLSVEGIFLDGGKPEIRESAGDESASLSIEVQSLVAAAIFSLPVGEQFEVFVKPGFAYWDSTTSFSYSSPTFSDGFSEDDNGSAFFLGAGVGWNFGKAGLRLEYEWFDVAPEYDYDTNEFEDELDATASFLSLSFIYNF